MSPTTISVAGLNFRWIDDWGGAAHADDPDYRRGWAHHDLAVLDSGDIVGFHAGRSQFIVYRPDGSVVGRRDTDLAEGHGIALAGRGDSQTLWVADIGRTRPADSNYESDEAPGGAQVVQLALDGSVLKRLANPNHPEYGSLPFVATMVTVADQEAGGSGDIWVADGYGASLVHRYNAAGEQLQTLDGTDGAGRFDCPHGVFIDHRGAEPELLVADRANHRVQVFDLEGVFKRSFGEDFLDSPSAFAVVGDLLVIADLRAHLVLTDRDDRPAGQIGVNPGISGQPGWPNALDAAGHPTRTTRLRDGRFNSPHGLAAGADGSVYVAEWLIGGRMIKLERIQAP
jgi:hypothetical protein